MLLFNIVEPVVVTCSACVLDIIGHIMTKSERTWIRQSVLYGVGQINRVLIIPLQPRCEGIKFYPCMHTSPAFGFCSITSVSLKGEFAVVPTDKICGQSLSSKIVESGIKYHNPNL